MTSVPTVDAFQSSLAYRFQRLALLQEALTHKSYVNEQKTSAGSHNERLEFLGDAALSLIISERLIALLPDSSEGTLSKFKARLVSEPVLAGVARRVNLGSCLLIGRGEERSNGRDKDSLLADALEAVIAAVYLDGGLNAAREVVVRLFEEELAQVASQQHRPGADDYKTQLQEWCQKRFDSLPYYAMVRESGPDHDKLFEVDVSIKGERLGRGAGHSKKEAEQLAAKQALEQTGT